MTRRGSSVTTRHSGMTTPLCALSLITSRCPVGTAVLSSDDLLSVDPFAPHLAGAGFTFHFVVCMLEERQSNVRAVLMIPLLQTAASERPFELAQRRLHQRK